jgi:hypothetical protein
MPMPKKVSLNDNEKAAVAAYANGDKTVVIQARFGLSSSQLYRCLDRASVELRDRKREERTHPKIKEERAPTPPTRQLCDWCGKPLSEDQCRQRWKYCCRACEREGVRDDKLRNLKPCQAPGCKGKAMEETDYCSLECFNTAMEARFR